MATLDRTTFAAALDGMRVPHLAMALRRAASPWITVLTYHRVADPVAAAEFDEGVVDVTPQELDRQLAFVRRWFRVVALDDVLAHARGGKRLPRNPVLVTFDDGYRDNHDVALPILRRHGVRATFFVATDYVTQRRLFWWDRVAFLLKRSTRRRIALEYPERVELPLHDAASTRASVRRVQRLIKDRPGLELGRLLDEVEAASGVALSSALERQMADELVLTWSHVIALRRAGMDVQSHTCSHRVLQTLGPLELARELRESRRVLEDALGETVRAVSYPVGKSLEGVPHVKRAVQDAGYELGFSNANGVNRVSAFDPLDARRISLDIETSGPMFRTMLAIPWLAGGS
jgi:peptidoglycan/xylan/chitin deacetylase (PgdA/CDA1 family)